MCGFVAIFHPQRGSVDEQLLDRMTDSLAHRGPDGRGTIRFPGCGLGHRRLSIIDLDGGAQPLSGADPNFWITLNGEVFNYRDVRATLPGPFKTQSDTEVFLRAFETKGLAGIEPLVGMWGAAIWDNAAGRLVVIRDRLGIKPVYYAPLNDGRYIFASEIRALLLHPQVSKHLDPVALDQLLTYRYVPGPRTLLRGIFKLQPGHAMCLDANGARTERYWRPESAADSAPLRSDEAAEEAFLEAFDRSVQDRMVSDVPVGLFLSGGLDSAAILQAMARPDLHAFTIGFEGNTTDDEIPLAAETARLFGAQHHTITIGPKDYEGYLDRYAAQLEEPVLNDSAIATHFLSKLAREHVKVVLSGQGADEPLAGYDRYKGEYLSAAFQRFGGARISEGLAPWMEKSPIPEKFKRAFRSLGEPDPIKRAIRIYAVVQEEDKNRLIRPELRTSDDVADPIRQLHARCASRSPLGRMLYTDTRLWLVDDLLMVADKLSMAHGLELRVPFLDHRLIELIERLDDRQKLRLSRRGFLSKRVHRAAMEKRLPKVLLERKKRGFNNPMDTWLRRDLQGLVQERLLVKGSPMERWFDPKGLRELHRAHLSGQDRRRQLFLLLTIDAWARNIFGAR